MDTNSQIEIDKDDRIAELEQQLTAARAEIKQLRSVGRKELQQISASENFIPKYTKGPWCLFQVDDECYSIRASNAFALTSQDLDFWFYDADENAMANAYLMAASPELYEALVSAKEQLAAYVETFLKTPFKDDQIETAIAKAEGRIR